MPPYDRVRIRSNEYKHLEDALFTIIQKLYEQDKTLEVMKGNVEALDKWVSHSRSIKLIEDLLDHILSHFYPSSMVPNGIRSSPIDKTWPTVHIEPRR